MTSILRIFSVFVIAFAIVIVLWPVISNNSSDKSKTDLEVSEIANAIAERSDEIKQYNNILRAVSVRGLLQSPSYLHADGLFQGPF